MIVQCLGLKLRSFSRCHNVLKSHISAGERLGKNKLSEQRILKGKIKILILKSYVTFSLVILNDWTYCA